MSYFPGGLLRGVTPVKYCVPTSGGGDADDVDDSRVQRIQVKVGQAGCSQCYHWRGRCGRGKGQPLCCEESHLVGRPALQMDINRRNEKSQLSSILKHSSISE